MKRILFIMASAAALAMAACNSDDDNTIPQSWTATEVFVSQHGKFDAEAIPAELLKMGLICCEDFWFCQSGKLYSYDEYRDGWWYPEVIFFEDGTCWSCWHEVPPRGPKYHVYTWSYDPQTAVITTSYTGDDTRPCYQNLKAQVKAFDGKSLILDGSLCNSSNVYGPVKEGGDESGYGQYPDFGIYQCLLMRPGSAERRQWWLDNAVKSNGMSVGM